MVKGLAFLGSRHVVVALLVTPILAVAAWFSVGVWVADDSMQPRPITRGEAYPLIERSGCRYGGGDCRLANGDVELAIQLPAGSKQLSIRSPIELDSVLVAIAEDRDDAPIAGVLDVQQQQWQVVLPRAPSTNDRLRVIATAAGSQFYGEVGLLFQGSPE